MVTFWVLLKKKKEKTHLIVIYKFKVKLHSSSNNNVKSVVYTYVINPNVIFSVFVY